MADEKSIRDIVARVTAELSRDAAAAESAFRVDELHTHLADFKGLASDNAWTISYSTSGIAELVGSEAIRFGSDNAWTISYSTSAAEIVAANPADKVTARPRPTRG